MKTTGLRTFTLTLAGACLLGMLWRVRGTHGWGAAWGLLAAGTMFTLFLSAAVKRKNGPSPALTAVTALSFMLTAPAWGTLLQQITGVLGGLPEGADPVYVSPAAGALLMALMGFGLAALFGVLLGRCFSEKAWRVRDYAVLLAVFLLVLYGTKASLSHPLVKLLQPQAAEAFRNGLDAAGINKSVFGAYMAHFNAEGWAKKITGGRHYYACVSAVSSALAAAASVLTARFYAKDRSAAKTGAFVCGAFAVSITIADLFFYFSAGGFHGAQGLSLPPRFAAWSLWEFFTGFLAGGAITLYLLKTVPAAPTRETALQKLPQRAYTAFSFLLFGIGAVGLNTVRPVLLRTEKSGLNVLFTAVTAVCALAFCLLLYKKKVFAPEETRCRAFAAPVCAALAAFTFAAYFFIGDAPEIASPVSVHNLLVIAAFIASEGVLSVKAASRVASGQWSEKQRAAGSE